MFDPVLAHNREEFSRLGRLKFKVFLRSLLTVPLLVVALILIGRSSLPGKAAEYLIVAWLGGLAMALGMLEIRRTIIFRRDLHEQRESNGATDRE